MQDKRPNILIFMTDQQRADSVPPYRRAITPNLDRLAENGITFSNNYCPSPHCCPSRATFFSGLYPTEHGVWNNVNVGNALSRGLNDGVKLWSEDLKEAGYKLSFSGKWHVSALETPEDRGWKITPSVNEKLKDIDPNAESWHPVLLEKKRWERYNKLAQQPETTSRDESQILRPGYPTYSLYGRRDEESNDMKVINEALEVIRNRKKSDGPWCQYIGPIGPHDPYYVHQEFLDLYNIDDIELPESFYDEMGDKPAMYRMIKERFSQLTELEHREAILHYLAFCSYEDWLFGKVIEELKKTDDYNNTLILYVSDHADYAGDHGIYCKGLPCFRTTYHIPAIMQWPDGIKNPGRVVDSMVSLADFGPTFLEVASIDPNRHFTGMSLAPYLKGETPAAWRDAIFTQTNGNELYGIQRSVMTEDWKYVFNGFDYDELYNLKDDPNEMHNLARDEKYKEMKRKMCKKLWRFAYDHKDTCINWYITTGLAAFGPAEAFRED